MSQNPNQPPVDIRLTMDEVQTVLNILAEHPFKHVANPILKMQAAIVNAVSKPRASEVAHEPPVKAQLVGTEPAVVAEPAGKSPAPGKTGTTKK